MPQKDYAELIAYALQQRLRPKVNLNQRSIRAHQSTKGLVSARANICHLHNLLEQIKGDIGDLQVQNFCAVQENNHQQSTALLERIAQLEKLCLHVGGIKDVFVQLQLAEKNVSYRSYGLTLAPHWLIVPIDQAQERSPLSDLIDTTTLIDTYGGVATADDHHNGGELPSDGTVVPFRRKPTKE
ncbi:MAG: hypothetical protein KC877_03205 [Candidatus Kaiserbacteria bacterium]|nr:hypothetical protein [Candidatus Kaiserbacteria bacterium]MCB9816102.1 hypothetical protein [Candidatus Nomurabacteria bacterium]